MPIGPDQDVARLDVTMVQVEHVQCFDRKDQFRRVQLVLGRPWTCLFRSMKPTVEGPTGSIVHDHKGGRSILETRSELGQVG